MTHRWLTRDGLDQLADRLEVDETERHHIVLARLESAPEKLITSPAAATTGTTEQHIRKIIGEWA